MLKTSRKAQVRQLKNKNKKKKLVRKQVLPGEAENDLAEHCLLMERKILA